MPRRFQFSLRALLVAMLVISAGLGLGVRWWTLRHRAALARERFDEEKAGFEVGIATFAEARAASDAALQAALVVPLQRERTAWLAHLERTKWLETKAWAILASGHSELHGKWERNYNESRGERQGIEQRLGLTADQTLTNYHRLLNRRAVDREAGDSDDLPPLEAAPPPPDDYVPPEPRSGTQE